MDSEKIKLVQESFSQIAPHMSKITRVFYDEFFDLRPDLKPLFTHDIRDQRKKLLKALTFIVSNLDKPHILNPYIKASAARHVTYGARPKDYRDFDQALLFALSAAFGDNFDVKTKRAWRETLATLSRTMIEFAYQEEVALRNQLWLLSLTNEISGLGDDFTNEVRAAWITTYKTLADVMKEAAWPGQA